MIKTDPVIAVKDIEVSSKWYQSVFDSRIEGQHIIRILSKDNEVLLCLHKWKEDQHPTMMNPGIPPGNGLILYFRTDNFNTIVKNAGQAGCSFAEEVHLNPRSNTKEFSLRDPDGYYLTISEFHTYGI